VKQSTSVDLGDAQCPRVFSESHGIGRVYFGVLSGEGISGLEDAPQSVQSVFLH
jgi:hypothetical protein